MRDLMPIYHTTVEVQLLPAIYWHEQLLVDQGYWISMQKGRHIRICSHELCVDAMSNNTLATP